MITLYTKPECNFCEMAKTLLQSYTGSSNVIEANDDEKQHFVRETYTQARTYPVVLIDGQYVGGYDKLVEYLKSKSGPELLMESN